MWKAPGYLYFELIFFFFFFRPQALIRLLEFIFTATTAPPAHPNQTPEQTFEHTICLFFPSVLAPSSAFPVSSSNFIPSLLVLPETQGGSPAPQSSCCSNQAKSVTVPFPRHPFCPFSFVEFLSHSGLHVFCPIILAAWYLCLFWSSLTISQLFFQNLQQPLGWQQTIGLPLPGIPRPPVISCKLPLPTGFYSLLISFTHPPLARPST